MTTETCTIKITMTDMYDSFHEEDVVKNLWPYMQPWFTRRHGVDKGVIILSDGAVTVEWNYETTYEPEYSAEPELEAPF